MNINYRETGEVIGNMLSLAAKAFIWGAAGSFGAIVVARTFGVLFVIVKAGG